MSKYTESKLPYDEFVAQSYNAFDLPYGTPIDQVTSRLEDYLRKCSPDVHKKNPELLADAYKLTGLLNWAHGVILKAWENVLEHSNGGLPYNPEVAQCYSALDLPYGAPIEEVSKRWKDYLKRCHPDRYASDPDKLPDANKLTQLLTHAYETIKEAWRKV